MVFSRISAVTDVRRIFCVDDDPAAQRVLMTALARPGTSVECACRGQEALDRYTADPHSFDVLVTTHGAPPASGLGLVARLRELGFPGAVIVVAPMLTADDYAAYQALGAAAVIQSPVDLAALQLALTLSPRTVGTSHRRPADAGEIDADVIGSNASASADSGLTRDVTSALTGGEGGFRTKIAH